MCGFSITLLLNGIRRFKVKESVLLLNKSVSSNINETESKMENPTPTYTFRRRILCFSSCKNQELKVKLVKKEELVIKHRNNAFCNVYFVRRKFF